MRHFPNLNIIYFFRTELNEPFFFNSREIKHINHHHLWHRHIHHSSNALSYYLYFLHIYLAKTKIQLFVFGEAFFTFFFFSKWTFLTFSSFFVYGCGTGYASWPLFTEQGTLVFSIFFSILLSYYMVFFPCDGHKVIGLRLLGPYSLLGPSNRVF